MEHTTELKHFGVKGMRWGVRKTPAERAESMGRKATKLDKKAEKFDKKAEKFGKQNIRSALGAMDVVSQAKMTKGALKYGMKAGTLDPLETSVSNHPKFQKMKYEVKAEEARRKATRLRAKIEKINGTNMDSVDKPKARLTFNSAKAKAKAYVSDRHNQKKAAVNADKGYKAYVNTRRAYKVVVLAATLKLAYEASKRIPGQKALPSHMPKKGPMKDGLMYVVDFDGVLRPNKVKI